MIETVGYPYLFGKWIPDSMGTKNTLAPALIGWCVFYCHGKQRTIHGKTRQTKSLQQGTGFAGKG